MNLPKDEKMREVYIKAILCNDGTGGAIGEHPGWHAVVGGLIATAMLAGLGAGILGLLWFVKWVAR